MFCPKCGAKNEDGATFCRKCGAELHLGGSIKESYTKDVPKEKSTFKNNKVLIICIIAVIVVAGCVGGYLLLMPQYKEISVIGVSMEVPDSDFNVTIQSSHSSNYMDSENHVVVYGFDSTNIGLSDLGDAIVFAGIRDGISKGSKSVTVDGVTFNETSNGTCCYSTYFGHKNLFIATDDEDTLVHIVKSLNANGESSNNADNSSIKIISGEISTGSSLEAKTHARIFVGSDHAGETIQITAKYSRDGASLNDGNILTLTVDSEGYVTFDSAEGFDKFPDKAVIEIYDANGSVLDSKTVKLDPSAGTQSF